MKRAVLLSLGFLLATGGMVLAAVPEDGGEYIANEIIVKFRQEVSEAVEAQLKVKSPADELALSPDLNRLNAKYGVRKIKPVFKNFRQRRQLLKALGRKDEKLLSKKEKRILRRLKRAGKKAKAPDLDRIYKLEVRLEEGQSLEEIVAAYRRNPDIEYAELNYTVSIFNSPNDPLYPLQWSLNNTGQVYPTRNRFSPGAGTLDRDIDAEEAWDKSTGVPDVIVAVLDSGVDYTHRDLDDNMWVNEAELNGLAGVDDDGNGYIDDIYGYDFLNDDPDPKDDHGHGTHCSGIIAAEGDNGLDVTGVCWTARIMGLKFLGADGGGSASAAAEAFYYAVENGADIVSNSWGGYLGSYVIEDAIDYAYSQGVVVVASAGNTYSNGWTYPAYYDHVIAVAATDSDDERPSFSTYGYWVEMAAPGVDILSLRADSTSMGTVYDIFTTVASGTSMACPHVSGAAAVLLSVDPCIPVDQLQDALMETADPIDPGVCISGRLNLYGAILRILGPQGTIWLEGDAYSCSDSIQIKLFDTDLSSSSTQQVTVATNGGDFETVLLSETSPTLGIFVGEISTSPGDPSIEDGQLQVSHGQIITASYDDADDGTGSPATVTDIASTDCQSPAIVAVEADGRGPNPIITIETDEPTAVRLLYAGTCGDSNYVEATDGAMATTHRVQLSGVSPETDYFFTVEANDAVDNHTVDANSGMCYRFRTNGPGDIYVPAEYATIQEGINRSWDGGTVWVADGRYTGEGNRDLDFRKKAITVRSESGPENCVVDCNGTKGDPHRGFYFGRGEDANSMVSGFAITNGYAFGSSYEERSGGAIRCNRSSPTITNCIMADNAGDWDAGGIFNYHSSPTVIDCAFIRNRAVTNDGGAISNDRSSPTIINCAFIGNRAFDWGGAIRNTYFCDPSVTNCLFSGNSCDEGGGMFYWFRCEPVVVNCTFAGNSARNGNAVGFDSHLQESPSAMVVVNSVLADGGDEIWNNDDSVVTMTYSNIGGGYPGEGNIDADPCFVWPGYWADANDPNEVVEPDDPNAVWIDGDYHLLAGSPCVDAGDNNGVSADTGDLDGDGNRTEPVPFDLDSSQRVVDGNNDGELVVDMGCYEYYVPPIEVAMKFTPQGLNIGSRGKWVKAHCVMPAGYVPEDVDTNTPAVLNLLNVEVESEQIEAFVNDDGLVEVEIAFDRGAFCGVETDGEWAEVVVTGSLSSGWHFYGVDSIKIANNNIKCVAVFASYWLEQECDRPDWCGGADLDQDSVVSFVDFALFDGCCIEVLTE
ncbi:MAG: S8 family serine peptidase [Planctomycetota bacterium]|jgi:subtilisin family serine protease